MTKKLQMCTKKSLSMIGQGFLIVSTDEKFFLDRRLCENTIHVNCDITAHRIFQPTAENVKNQGVTTLCWQEMHADCRIHVVKSETKNRQDW